MFRLRSYYCVLYKNGDVTRLVGMVAYSMCLCTQVARSMRNSIEWKARRVKKRDYKKNWTKFYRLFLRKGIGEGDYRLTPCLAELGRGKKHHVNGEIHF